ncbi:MAG: ADOP family duplicated permease [Terriglobales bacterium]
MNAIARVLRRLAMLLARSKFHDELGDEMAFHREQAERELQSQGMSAEEAHSAAARQFGNATRLREESVDRIAFGFETTLHDLRYALRQLRHHPGFAITAILILALGIGATTAIFSAVDPILFKPLPYPNARRLVMVWEGKDTGGRMVNFAIYRSVAEQTPAFASLAVMKPWQATVTGTTQPERFVGQRVSADYFRTLCIAPALGRDFTAADDLFRGPNVVILSYGLWERRFRGDRNIVGQAVRIDDNPYTVIGVMPAGYENVLAPEAQLWAPLQYDPALLPNTREWGHHLRAVGRLRPGVTPAQATAETEAIIPRMTQEYAKGFDTSGGPPTGFIIDPLQADVTQDVRPALLAVLGAVLLVLLIACVNVTNLLLARGAQRRGEFAMRVALGASRSRVVRQMITESLVVSVAGGAVGIVVAEYGVRALVALSPPELPRLSAIRVDAMAFVFALSITFVVGIVIGVIPALQAFGGKLQSRVQLTGRGSSAGHQATRRTLVVAEVALAVVLLACAGLLLRSLQRLFSNDPGFDPAHVLTMQVLEASHRYDKDPARLEFFRQALDSVRALPGMEAAAFTSQLPLSGDSDTYGIYFAKDNPTSHHDGMPALRYAVTPDYFKTMGIPLRRGRTFNERDTANSPRVAIINESLARREFGEQDPIGQRICLRCDTGPDQPWSLIVGVAADVKQSSLATGEEDAFYVPNPQWYWADNVMSLVVRTHGDPAAATAAVKNAVWGIDKDVPIVRVATMTRLLDQSEAQRHFTMTIFEVFALIALLLAATGIYGVLSGSVSERMREIGVRAALGASRADILNLVLRQGMAMTGIGVLFGIAGAAAASRALTTILFGISRLDPATYSAVVVLLAVVSAVACAVPAWRAARVDPSITLRAE